MHRVRNERGLDVVLNLETIGSDEDPIWWALAIAQHYFTADYQGHVGISLGIVSRNRAEYLYALERMAEEFHSVSPNLFISFIFTFKEALDEAQAQTSPLRPIPSLGVWFSAWLSDPVPGLMHVMPSIALPPDVWQRFEDLLQSQAGLEQAA